MGFSHTLGTTVSIFGLGCLILSVVLFFDRTLISIGNVLFFGGLCLAMGVDRTIELCTT
jgi:hypothetical protein